MLAPWSDDIGRLARQQRIDLGLSQDELAERAGVTRQWLSRFEQAKADVSLTKALQVLRELGLAVDVSPRAAAKASATKLSPVPWFSLSASEAIAQVDQLAKAYGAIRESLPADVQHTLLRLNDASSRVGPAKKPTEKQQ